MDQRRRFVLCLLAVAVLVVLAIWALGLLPGQTPAKILVAEKPSVYFPNKPAALAGLSDIAIAGIVLGALLLLGSAFAAARYFWRKGTDLAIQIQREPEKQNGRKQTNQPPGSGKKSSRPSPPVEPGAQPSKKNPVPDLPKWLILDSVQGIPGRVDKAKAIIENWMHKDNWNEVQVTGKIGPERLKEWHDKLSDQNREIVDAMVKSPQLYKTYPYATDEEAEEVDNAGKVLQESHE